MREVDRRTKVSRRIFLRGSATAVPAAAVAAAGMSISPEAAWAQDAKNLTPRTMATLARMARDIYPHDRLADVYYVKAVAGYDAKAGAGRRVPQDGRDRRRPARCRRAAAPQEPLPDGGVGSRSRRAAASGRAGRRCSRSCTATCWSRLYNNKEVWPKFGYEGASADKGGYINRGFNDIDWLTAGIGEDDDGATFDLNDDGVVVHRRLRRRRRHAGQRAGAEGHQGGDPGGRRAHEIDGLRQRRMGELHPARLARQAHHLGHLARGARTSRTCRPGSSSRSAARRCTGPAPRCASRSTSSRRAAPTATSPARTCSTGRSRSPRLEPYYAKAEDKMGVTAHQRHPRPARQQQLQGAGGRRRQARLQGSAHRQHVDQQPAARRPRRLPADRLLLPGLQVAARSGRRSTPRSRRARRPAISRCGPNAMALQHRARCRGQGHRRGLCRRGRQAAAAEGARRGAWRAIRSRARACC